MGSFQTKLDTPISPQKVSLGIVVAGTTVHTQPVLPGQAQLPPAPHDSLRFWGQAVGAAGKHGGTAANAEGQLSAQVPRGAGGDGAAASTGVIACVDGPVVVSFLERGHYTPGLHLELGRSSVWEGARQACARVPAVQKTDSALGGGAALAAVVH